MERIDPGASDGGLNFEIQALGAGLESFEVSEISPENTQLFGSSETSNGRIWTFDPPLNASGSGLSSAVRIDVNLLMPLSVRQAKI